MSIIFLLISLAGLLPCRSAFGYSCDFDTTLSFDGATESQPPPAYAAVVDNSAVLGNARASITNKLPQKVISAKGIIMDRHHHDHSFKEIISYYKWLVDESVAPVLYTLRLKVKYIPQISEYGNYVFEHVDTPSTAKVELKLSKKPNSSAPGQNMSSDRATESQPRPARAIVAAVVDNSAVLGNAPRANITNKLPQKVISTSVRHSLILMAAIISAMSILLLFFGSMWFVVPVPTRLFRNVRRFKNEHCQDDFLI